MLEQLIVDAQGNHVSQWVQLKRHYMAKRGSTTGRNKKAIPKTTNGDIAELTRYWHSEFIRELERNPAKLDKDVSKRAQWRHDKATLTRQLQNAPMAALYAENEWFWDTSTLRVALYLNGRKAVPSRTSLFFDSIAETVTDGIDAAKDAAHAAYQGGSKAIKVGALVVGGAVGAVLLIRLLR